MLIVGIVLLIIGYVLAVPLVEDLGIILTVVGLLLWALGAAGHPLGGRRWY